MACNFIFCLHNHQPVGNFEHVFEWAYQSCYSKIIEVLFEFPEFKFALHHSGPVLEWIQTNNPEYLEKLNTMVKRGQVEVIGGGFYEPIFSIISESDIKGQLAMMQDFWLNNYNIRPSGFWTAERVWDPEIPRLVNGHGLKYTILDDNHFKYAGIGDDDLYGYFITERLQYPLNIFPIDKFLRYSIPFREPEETVNYFKEITEKLGDAAFIYGDDGEKFGLWPGTFKWVHEKKWLIRFVTALLENDWIKTTLPSEYIANNAPRGRVYLTQGSYFELSEWALPPESALKLMKIHREIKDWGREKDFYSFLKGGIWNNFLNKYPESNSINKRTLLLSREIGEAEKSTGESYSEEKRELYKGECNCAYWHGLFGGIYLNNLRHALYEHILKAERLLMQRQKKTFDLVEGDFWNDGEKQILVRTKEQSAIIVPYSGGMISELGFYKKAINIFNTMPRRFEAYHEALREMNDEPVNHEEWDSVASIHDMTSVREKGLKNYLAYDGSRKYSFKDLLFPHIPSAEDIMFGRTEVFDCGNLSYDYRINSKQQSSEIELHRTLDFKGEKLEIQKTYILELGRAGVRSKYKVSGGRGSFIGVELNINLLAERADDRVYKIEGVKGEDAYLNSLGVTHGLKSFSLEDNFFGFKVRIKSSRDSSMVRYPIYTVSQSDKGFERNFQGSSIIIFIKLEDGLTEFNLDLEIE